MASIFNRNIKSVHAAILFRAAKETNNSFGLDIIPERQPDAESKLRLMTKFKYITYSLDGNRNDIPSMKSILGNEFEAEGYQIRIKLTKDNNIVDKILHFCSHSDLRKCSLIANNADGLEETINLLETLYTKKISIDISSNEIANLNKIKTLLQKSVKNTD